ncbi:MAG: DJ-1/PfpI family protein [Firmicutes bacterium]|nr:DJ-1/PfpI family protein [Bacillota bacterium]
MKIACLLSDGFEDIEALGTVALLRRAGIICEFVSVFNNKTVKGSYGTEVIPEVLMKKINTNDYDGIFIPGGKHAKVLRETKSVLDLVTTFHSQNKWLMAICAGPTVFGVLGFLDGVNYTSFPSTEVHMPRGIRQKQKAVRDGRIITGIGAGAVYEFAFEIISALLGDAVKLQVIKVTQYMIN